MPTVAVEEDVIWYDVVGDGPPLVFVHGGWSHADAWQRQVDYFADDYRVVTLDVRGHGETGPGDRRRYSIELFADDLEAVFDHLGIERPVICGLSLGAIIAQAYLDRHPERAAGAILAGPARSMPPVELPRPLKSALSPLPALTTLLSTAGSEGAFRWLLAANRAATAGSWLAVDPAVRERAIETVGEIPPSEYRKIFSALYRFDPPDLTGVTTPIRVIYGEEESPLVKRQGRQIAAAVARGTVTEIPDAGHLVNLDNPAAFNTACAEFLAELEIDEDVH